MTEVGVDSARLHVAAAVITDDRDRVLVSRRAGHLHQGGRWEFPGGKLLAGETAEAGLGRELHEELGITVLSARPLIRIHHDYPDRAVLLDVWRVSAFAGKAVGREGQAIAWVAADRLRRYRFPAANAAILKAVALPERYLITPAPGSDMPGFLDGLERVLARGVRLVQLRAKQSPAADLERLVPPVRERCRRAGARLLVNAEPALAVELGTDGVHLSSTRLMALPARPPVPPDHLVAASCHTLAEVRRACELALDFIVVSPVQATASHPCTPPIGFEGLRNLTETATVPVYALGGMRETDLDMAWRHGAQGIAAIRGLWGED
ncbi:MAG: Nudix family hydrolase [Gammaproteobacteria bacterium]